MKKSSFLCSMIIMLCLLPLFTVSAGAAGDFDLCFDDHVDMSGKTVEIIDAGTPTSYQVGYGVAENAVPDTAVLTLSGDTLIATGVGKATIMVDGEACEVTVTAAPISLLLLIGQSNMRGSEGNADQSIVCPDGMVYATFGDDRGDAAGVMNVNNATKFAASALTGPYSTVNVEGTKEHLSYYPLNSLTEEGAGTFGPDSGFAYEWVRQTGEKVWVVNAAHGGSSITTWQPNATNYKEAVLLFKACQETLQKEINAGHYTLSHMGYFWCQGCTDRTQSAEWYVQRYLAMHNGLKAELTLGERALEFGGIIPVRVGNTVACYRDGAYDRSNPYAYHESFVDLRFNGPRVAQYWMCNNPELEDIWMVCNIGEDWVWMPDGTNGVADYFGVHYENGTVDYTTQVPQKAAWYTPATPKAVHDSVHYNQIGYNEIGRESVRNALILLGEIEAPDVETSVALLGWDGYTEVESVTASTAGSSATLVVPKIYPLWKTKEVACSLTDGLEWNYYDLLSSDEGMDGTLSMGDKAVSVVGHDWSAWTTVSEPSPEGAGQEQRICADCGKTDTKTVDGVWQKYDLSAHLLELPENVCCDTNLWAMLPHEDVHFTSGKKWGTTSTPVTSITIPLRAGDRVYATSWNKAGENGHEKQNGIRLTFFDAFGIAQTLGPGESYNKFAANGGYLVAPEGTIAINIAMWYDSENYEVYILNREHSYENGICTGCGDCIGPVITRQPTDGKAKSGEEFCVTVEAEGEGLTYTWYGRDAGAASWFKSSITDNTYDSIMTSARAGREIYCVITDAHGNSVTTNTVKLVLLPTYIWEQWTQPVTMVAGTYPTYSGDGYRKEGQVFGGIIYSSTMREGTDALWNFNHSTYYSAAANPASLLYTVNNTGRVPNEAAWMGSVCNTTALRACGYKYPYTTAEIPVSPEFAEKTDHRIDALEFGDILWVKGHVAGVVGVTRGDDGRTVSVKIVEQASVVKVFEVTAANWDSYFAAHWTTIYRGDFDESLTAPIEYPENYSIIFERGNNTYVTDTSRMLFYIPAASTVYLTKDGTTREYAVTSFPAQTVNNTTVYDLSSLFAGVGDYYFHTEENTTDICIKVIDPGTISIDPENGTAVLHGYSANCTPLGYRVIRIIDAADSKSYNFFHAPQGYTSEAESLSFRWYAGDAFDIENIPEDAAGWKLEVYYDTGYGWARALSEDVIYEVEAIGDPLLAQGRYWPNHRMRPNNHNPEVDNEVGYWLYTMVPVKADTTYYSEGCTRLWFLDAGGNPISTTNAYKESAVPFTFATPENCAYVSIQYSPELIKRGTETLTEVTSEHTHIYENGICTGCGERDESACEHIAVTDPAVKAASGKTGLTEGSHCEICGEVLAAQEVIPARGYDWMTEDGEFKLLLIGNSYSEDASNCGQGMKNSQLLEILRKMLGEGVKVTVGLAYNGGKGINWHATQAEQGTTAYAFTTVSSDAPSWKSRGRVTSATALSWTDWDVVSLQPYNANPDTGKESVPYPDTTDEKFYLLETASEYMLDHIDKYAPQADVYCYMHWAQTSSIQKDAALSKYHKMAAFYPAVLDYVGEASGGRFADLIPVGLSVQNARTTYLALLAYNTSAYADKNLNLVTDAQIGLQRDGGHLSFNIGRYLAALTFAETILPDMLRAEGYALPDIRVTESLGVLPKEYTVIAQKAVQAAVESWRQGSLAVTEIEGYEEDPAHAAGELLAAAMLEVTCTTDGGSIAEAALAILPEDFAVDRVALEEETSLAVGDSFACDVTIRFGYTSLTVKVSGVVADHGYEAAVTAPTCTEQGYTTYTCACGDSYVENYVPAAGHVYDDDRDADCNTCGEVREVAGATVRGTVKGSRGAKVTLLGAESCETAGSYEFTGVAQGVYDLVVKEGGCLTYTVKNIPVEEREIVLAEIELVRGDMNGDDMINARDIGTFRRDFGKAATNCANPYTDLNGDGNVNARDINLLRRSFGKSTLKDCTVEYTA